MQQYIEKSDFMITLKWKQERNWLEHFCHETVEIKLCSGYKFCQSNYFKLLLLMKSYFWKHWKIRCPVAEKGYEFCLLYDNKNPHSKQVIWKTFLSFDCYYLAIQHDDTRVHHIFGSCWIILSLIINYVRLNLFFVCKQVYNNLADVINIRYYS